MRSRLIEIVAMLFCCSVSAAAQAAPDITGMWIVQDPGSGNWADWFNNVPKPALRPEIIKDNEAMAAREAAGAVVNRAERLATCPFGNLPMMMASSPPLNIVQSMDEILIGAEANVLRLKAFQDPSGTDLHCWIGSLGQGNEFVDGGRGARQGRRNPKKGVDMLPVEMLEPRFQL